MTSEVLSSSFLSESHSPWVQPPRSKGCNLLAMEATSAVAVSRCPILVSRATKVARVCSRDRVVIVGAECQLVLFVVVRAITLQNL